MGTQIVDCPIELSYTILKQTVYITEYSVDVGETKSVCFVGVCQTPMFDAAAVGVIVTQALNSSSKSDIGKQL